jgi:8-hydroxy-5-deazaflavin:NADPH oxidoreductase
MKTTRRTFLQAAAAASLLASLPLSFPARAASMKIGVIGSGRIGGALGEFWVRAGHEVMFSARTLEEVNSLLARLNLGPRAIAGTPREAAAFGEVVLISIPYAALPQIGRDLAEELKGKVVLETGNPYPQRDGPMAYDARSRGTGVTSAEFLPGVRLVRAFNSVGDVQLRNQMTRSRERIAIPLAADDPEAMKVAARLVEDAGFEPVVVGSLARAKEFDFGTKVYGEAFSARQLRWHLGIRD